MGKYILASISFVAAIAFFSSRATAREYTKSDTKAQAVNKELRLDEIIACGYAYAFLVKNGDEYLCYGEINKMDFSEMAGCHKVKATLDKKTGRPSEIIYLSR